MPSNAFIHYLSYCDLDVELTPPQTLWLDRLPKKLTKSVIEQANAQGAHILFEAWGVYVKEGLNMEMFICACIVVTVVVAAPLLGVIIAVADIQSAFAVVGLPVSLGVGLLAAWLQFEKGRDS